jgi:hypothetical protein
MKIFAVPNGLCDGFAHAAVDCPRRYADRCVRGQLREKRGVYHCVVVCPACCERNVDGKEDVLVPDEMPYSSALCTY